jgi:hypothetical protein
MFIIKFVSKYEKATKYYIFDILLPFSYIKTCNQNDLLKLSLNIVLTTNIEFHFSSKNIEKAIFAIFSLKIISKIGIILVLL